MNKDTSWGRVADWYDDVVKDDDSYQTNVILHNILRIMEPKRTEKILDLGCGQGYFSHAMASEGAYITGIDVSPELVSLAKRHAGHNEEFFVTPAENLSQFKAGTYTAAISILAIQNMERMADVFREVGRVVKPGGKFVIVLNHPTFRIPGKSSWGFDDKASVQYRRVDEYMSESRAAIDMNPGSKEKKETTYSFHRPLQVYSKTLANAGFAIKRIEEWTSHKQSEKGPRQAAENRARKEIPLFMCLECMKL
jgi:ubiquinone/menaquinone biosynthesis C-methylase UbiE